MLSYLSRWGSSKSTRLYTRISTSHTSLQIFTTTSYLYTTDSKKLTTHSLPTFEFSESSPRPCSDFCFSPLLLSLRCRTSSYGLSLSTFVTLRDFENIPTSICCQASQTLPLFMNRTKASDHMPCSKHIKSLQLFELDQILYHIQTLPP